MQKQSVIAAVRSEADLREAIESPVRSVFMLGGELCTLGEQCSLLHNAGKTVFLHLDLVDGIKGDESGIRFLSRGFNLAGVISTKANVLKIAQNYGLLGILRVFILDSSALKTGVAHSHLCQPSFVEVLPGVSEKIIRLAVEQFKVPVIAGGLISEQADVENALKAGASAVSTSNYALWH